MLWSQKQRTSVGLSVNQYDLIEIRFVLTDYITYQLYPDMKELSLLFLLLAIALINVLASTEYKVSSKQIGSSFVKLELDYFGKANYYIKQKSVIVKKLVFLLRCYSFLDLDFKIYDPQHQRYEVPQGGIFPIDPSVNFTFPIQFADFSFIYTETPFTFKIIRKSTNEILFDTENIQIIFSEYYIQIGTTTSSDIMYGFSQRFAPNFRVKPGKWTMFPRDRGQMMDYGLGKQTHGYYPIYLLRDNGKKFHISYFRSSNALDAIVESHQNRYKVTYKTIGGIIDIRLFLGQNNAETLLNRLHNYMGRSAVPPFWSLGFHQCKWGYNNVSVLENVVAQFAKNDIPLDTIWSDIDYMKQSETFTIDQDRFPLDRMAKIIQNHHYIPIVEPSIRLGKGYAYQQGKKRDLFIKDAEGGDQVGKVWAGQVVFTDYFHPNATQYWMDMLQHLYDKIKFSGVWLDMNEISNLCNGPCKPPATTGIDYTNDIPYHPGNDKIQTQAIPLNATHFGNRVQANVHTYFGFMQTYATYQFLLRIGRPFIITRSNTLGSNKYGFHWTGDNYANYDFLRISIASNMMFSMWGIQMVGSDICGFGGNVTDQLCARWFQLGSLYPFARNHNQNNTIDQQPYALGPLTLKSSIVNLKLRYSLLKQYYRQFVGRRGEGAIFKPLFFQFHDDPQVYTDQIAETQFLIGNALMSAPIVQQGKTTRTAYFPKNQNWYDFYTGQFYQSGTSATINNKPDDKVPLFLREGHIRLTQDTQKVTKSSELDNIFALVGAFKYNSQRSNGTVSIYDSTGGVLSIKDYNNQINLGNCLQKGCQYQLIASYEHNKYTGSKTLILNVLFAGDKSIQQQVIINSLTIYTKDQKINKMLTSNPIKITGMGQKTINLLAGKTFQI